MSLLLEVYSCAQERNYRVQFENEEAAVKFVSNRTSTHAFSVLVESPIPDNWSELTKILFPTCEHGMSLISCYGPDHFMTAQQEQDMNWQYLD